jgi:hypothetical protein
LADRACDERRFISQRLLPKAFTFLTNGLGAAWRFIWL